ncbi:hypothetical protein, partial [Escherichia coli]
MSQNLDATAINQIHALISAQGVSDRSYTHLTLP